MAKNKVKFEGDDSGIQAMMKSSEAKDVVQEAAKELEKMLERKIASAPSASFPDAEATVTYSIRKNRYQAKIDFQPWWVARAAKKHGWVADAMRAVRSSTPPNV